ncbi:DUF2786 domain-containing protein [Rhodococcus spelaei]|uniref:DUF2786 domain-containing protein n=1 Tax=Rhodococcus spelaei TaxID=2546320 RepID=A0A541B446_9NOCA|nr:DUF2786 domain-containing protein [Rhodococcus spelaei]TQF67097.1 DUF2786 domain-containing protein [Rhodococcus spelaei]
MSSEKMLARIGGLLRQAESTTNPHEAQAFMEAAQRLATATSIDLAVARSHTSQRERRATPVQRSIRIGETGKKGLRTYVHLFVSIAAANDVQCDVAHNSTQVFAYGFDTDIDACEALYSSLLLQMVRASDAFIRSGAHRPVAGVTARLNFQLAFAARIGERLATAKREAEADAIRADAIRADTVRADLAGAAPEPTGTALVLRDKQIELSDFYQQTSQARGTWRGSKATVAPSAKARRAGDRAGREARLGPSPELPAGRRQLA